MLWFPRRSVNSSQKLKSSPTVCIDEGAAVGGTPFSPKSSRVPQPLVAAAFPDKTGSEERSQTGLALFHPVDRKDTLSDPGVEYHTPPGNFFLFEEFFP